MIQLEESNEDSEYEIEKIIGKRISKKGIIEYKIKWLGYDDSQSSWEPLSNLNHAKEAIKEYENKNIENSKNNFTSSNKIKEEILSSFINKETKIKKEYKNKGKNNKVKKYHNSIKATSPFICIKNIFDNEKKNFSNFEIIQINSICKINDKYHASVLIRKNDGEKKNHILSTSKIADIAPKKLIKFYEDNIRFYD